MNAQFHLQRLVAQQWRERVMIGEIRQVHARLATRRQPRFPIAIRLKPTRAVTELAGRAEALNIFHERAGVIHLHTGVREIQLARPAASDGIQRRFRPILIGRDSISHIEDIAHNLRARMRASAILRLDRVPSVLVMISRGALVRPVNRLMQMPEERSVHVMVLSKCDCRSYQREENDQCNTVAAK